MTRRATPWVHTMWGVRWTAIVVGACLGVALLGAAALIAHSAGAL